MAQSDWPRDNAELAAQLIRQRERYEQLVNNMSDLLMLIEPDGRVSFCNRAGELPPGGDAFPATGCGALDKIDEKDRPPISQAMQEVLSGKVRARSVMFHTRAVAGAQRIIEGTITPIFDDGNVVQLEFLGRDVTERQKADEALRQANTALKRQQEQLRLDLEVAGKIHDSLLPSPLENPRILVDLKHMALLGVGGDYVYLHDGSPERPSAAIFDVSGHGIASALVAGRVHSAVYAIMQEGSPPPEMIRRLNRFIYDSFADLGTYVTLMAVSIDLDAKKLCYCGAGHPPAVLVRGGQTQLLESTHLPIGVAPNIFVGKPMQTIDIAPGDAIWLYTDGLMELRRNREILGVNGLRQRLAAFDTSAARAGTAEELLNSILADFDPPDDDITVMLIKIK